MTLASSRVAWHRRFEKNEDALPRMLAQDPYENWERNRMPESSVEEELIDALNVVYAESDSPLVRRFLERSLGLAQRALVEDKVTSPLCEGRFPENLGRLLRAKSYAEALFHGRLNEDELREASLHYEGWSKAHSRRDWDAVVQRQHLAAVRLALMVGDAERALALLKDKRGFRDQKHDADFFGALAAAVRATPTGPLTDEALRQSYDAFFDAVREPGWGRKESTEVPMLRFELGALRDKYFVSPDRTIDWRRTIEAISA